MPCTTIIPCLMSLPLSAPTLFRDIFCRQILFARDSVGNFSFLVQTVNDRFITVPGESTGVRRSIGESLLYFPATLYNRVLLDDFLDHLAVRPAPITNRKSHLENPSNTVMLMKLYILIQWHFVLVSRKLSVKFYFPETPPLPSGEVGGYLKYYLLYL